MNISFRLPHVIPRTILFKILIWFEFFLCLIYSQEARIGNKKWRCNLNVLISDCVTCDPYKIYIILNNYLMNKICSLTPATFVPWLLSLMNALKNLFSLDYSRYNYFCLKVEHWITDQEKNNIWESDIFVFLDSELKCLKRSVWCTHLMKAWMKIRYIKMITIN